MKRGPLVFVHIPKTGGVALTRALGRSMPVLVGGGFDRLLFGAFTAFDQLAPEIQAMIYLNGGAGLPRGDGLVSAHMALSTLTTAYPDGRFFTILREPISRLLSLWTFWRAHSDQDLMSWGPWGELVKRARLPLHEMLASPELACQTDNPYVRTLLWPDPRIPSDGFIEPSHDSELLRDAVERLRRLDFAGILEDPFLIERVGDWLHTEISFPIVNASPPLAHGRQSRIHREFTERAIDLLSARSRMDASLWRVTAEQRAGIKDAAGLRLLAALRQTARVSGLLEGGGGEFG